MLPPANTVKIDSKMHKGLNINSWWDYDFTKATEKSMSFEFAKSETRRLFEQAIHTANDFRCSGKEATCQVEWTQVPITSMRVQTCWIDYSTFTCGFDMR